MGDVLGECLAASGSDARLVWVDREFLAREGVQPYSDLPLWVPDTPEHAGFARLDCSRAVAAGLAFRSLRETVRDTLAWARTLPPDRTWRAGLSPEREAGLLERWAAGQGRPKPPG
jgi:2'-hydroxyisoflavone reductase